MSTHCSLVLASTTLPATDGRLPEVAPWTFPVLCWKQNHIGHFSILWYWDSGGQDCTAQWAGPSGYFILHLKSMELTPPGPGSPLLSIPFFSPVTSSRSASAQQKWPAKRHSRDGDILSLGGCRCKTVLALTCCGLPLFEYFHTWVVQCTDYKLWGFWQAVPSIFSFHFGCLLYFSTQPVSVHMILSLFQLEITSVFLKTLHNVYPYFFLCWSFWRPLWRWRLKNPVGFIRMWLWKQTSLLEELVQERAGPGALTPAPHHPIPLGMIWQCFGQPVQVPGLHGCPDHWPSCQCSSAMGPLHKQEASIHQTT